MMFSRHPRAVLAMMVFFYLEIVHRRGWVLNDARVRPVKIVDDDEPPRSPSVTSFSDTCFNAAAQSAQRDKQFDVAQDFQKEMHAIQDDCKVSVSSDAPPSSVGHQSLGHTPVDSSSHQNPPHHQAPHKIQKVHSHHDHLHDNHKHHHNPIYHHDSQHHNRHNDSNHRHDPSHHHDHKHQHNKDNHLAQPQHHQSHQVQRHYKHHENYQNNTIQTIQHPTFQHPQQHLIQSRQVHSQHQQNHRHHQHNQQANSHQQHQHKGESRQQNSGRRPSVHQPGSAHPPVAKVVASQNRDHKRLPPEKHTRPFESILQRQEVPGLQQTHFDDGHFGNAHAPQIHRATTIGVEQSDVPLSARGFDPIIRLEQTRVHAPSDNASAIEYFSPLNSARSLHDGVRIVGRDTMSLSQNQLPQKTSSRAASPSSTPSGTHFAPFGQLVKASPTESCFGLSSAPTSGPSTPRGTPLSQNFNHFVPVSRRDVTYGDYFVPPHSWKGLSDNDFCSSSRARSPHVNASANGNRPWNVSVLPGSWRGSAENELHSSSGTRSPHISTSFLAALQGQSSPRAPRRGPVLFTGAQHHRPDAAPNISVVHTNWQPAGSSIEVNPRTGHRSETNADVPTLLSSQASSSQVDTSGFKLASVLQTRSNIEPQQSAASVPVNSKAGFSRAQALLAEIERSIREHPPSGFQDLCLDDGDIFRVSA
mmetsp:Transcript_43035/g.68096  ORF Transcript_43035/g.68096 Transcript_43035/m.68096 type:complete len:699 (+) Transcript_43035:1745-3841(+)